MRRFGWLLLVCALGAYWAWQDRPIERSPGVLAPDPPSQRLLDAGAPVFQKTATTSRRWRNSRLKPACWAGRITASTAARISRRSIWRWVGDRCRTAACWGESISSNATDSITGTSRIFHPAPGYRNPQRQHASDSGDRVCRRPVEINPPRSYCQPARLSGRSPPRRWLAMAQFPEPRGHRQRCLRTDLGGNRGIALMVAPSPPRATIASAVAGPAAHSLQSSLFTQQESLP